MASIKKTKETIKTWVNKWVTVDDFQQKIISANVQSTTKFLKIEILEKNLKKRSFFQIWTLGYIRFSIQPIKRTKYLMLMNLSRRVLFVVFLL